jgi:hypothetical protein
MPADTCTKREKARHGILFRGRAWASLQDAGVSGDGYRWCRRFAPQPPANGCDAFSIEKPPGRVDASDTSENGTVGGNESATRLECRRLARSNLGPHESVNVVKEF